MQKKRMSSFSKEEDEKLALLVSQLGEDQFEAIAAQMEGRTSRQVKSRWVHYLSNKYNKPWTLDEETILLEQYAKYGSNWNLILKSFPSRSISNIKNKYQSLQFKLRNRVNHDCIAALKSSNNDKDLDPRDIKDIEETLKPYIEGLPENASIKINDNSNTESNSELNMSCYPQSRNVQSTTPSSITSHATNMKQFSCFQTGQITKSKYQSTTGSNYPINIDSCIRDYYFEKEIGKGAFASVALAINIKTNQQFAAKIIPIEPLNASLKQLIQNELEIIQNLNHPNIVKYYEHFETPDHRYVIIITECCVCALWQYMNSPNISFQDMKEIAWGIIQGIKYLHQNNISHSDIKIENILLDRNKIPKICDFGFSRHHQSSPIDTTPPLTLTYAPPEAFKSPAIDLIKADVYALGITLFMLSSRNAEFYKVKDPNVIRHRTLYDDLPINPNDGLQRLAAKCVTKDPNQRPTIEEISEDDFFK